METLKKTLTIKNTFDDDSILSALPLIEKSGIEIEKEPPAKLENTSLDSRKDLTFYFDVVDLKLLERSVSNPIIDVLVAELHKIHSFSTAGGKLVYASFNKDKKVTEKGKKRTTRLAFESFKKPFSTFNNTLDEGIIDKIYTQDSLEFLKTLPDNSIDIVLTSPPYNFGISYNSTDDANEWKEYFHFLFGIFSECVRVVKSEGRIIVNVQPLFSDYIPTHHFVSKFFIDSGLIWKGEILWEKNNYNCKYCTWGSWKSPASPYLKYSWEFIEIFCKNSLKKSGNKENIDITPEEFKKWVYGKWSIAPERNMKKWGHDAMFPCELVKRCLKLFSYKKDIVLDPFNGAGTTTFVAKELERHYIGVDIDEKYCAVARERLREVNNLF